MKIALCMITAGDSELNDLMFAINSVAGQVDEVCITANGGHQKEGTEAVKNYCENNGFKYQYLKWNDDFSEQRNANFAQVSEDIDYVFWLDTDDELVGGRYLRKACERAKKLGLDAVFLTYWYGCQFKGDPLSYNTLHSVEFTQMRERIINPRAIQWKGMLHETPIEVPGKKYTHVTMPYDEKRNPIAVLHRSADRNIHETLRKDKTERNRRIIEKQLKLEQASGKVDPRTFIHLIKIYAQIGEEKELKSAILMGRQYLELSGWDEERSVCCMEMANCFIKLGNENEALQILYRAYHEFPYNPMIPLRLAQLYFNMHKYKSMKHWMDVGDKADYAKTTAVPKNLIQVKFTRLELKVKYYMNVDKDLKKAHEAMKEIYELFPSKTHEEQLQSIVDLKSMDDAFADLHGLTNYLRDIGRHESIPGILDNLPKSFHGIEFYHKLRNTYCKPRSWGEKEICYYASMGGRGFEKWDGNSVKTGIGGSETAVIRLSEWWTKMGYKVTVYGDPKEEVEVNGVTYKPWYMFNPKDRFNIVIQWRSSHLSHQIVAKKFYVDLHDMWNEVDHVDKLGQIDGFFVKSKYHRDLAPQIPDDKFIIISNGIDV